MEEDLVFLNLIDLSEVKKGELLEMINPLVINPSIKFPWIKAECSMNSCMGNHYQSTMECNSSLRIPLPNAPEFVKEDSCLSLVATATQVHQNQQTTSMVPKHLILLDKTLPSKLVFRPYTPIRCEDASTSTQSTAVVQPQTISLSQTETPKQPLADSQVSVVFDTGEPMDVQQFPEITPPLMGKVISAPLPTSSSEKSIKVGNGTLSEPVSPSTEHNVKFASLPCGKGKKVKIELNIPLNQHTDEKRSSPSPNLNVTEENPQSFIGVISSTQKQPIYQRAPFPKSAEASHHKAPQVSSSEFSAKLFEHDGNEEAVRESDLKSNLSVDNSKKEVNIPSSPVSYQQSELIYCQSNQPSFRSFADVLRNRENKATKDLSTTEVIARKDNKDAVANFMNSSCEIISCINDGFSLAIKRYLDQKLQFLPLSLIPRGLVNTGNWCYINASIQALLACPPFHRLIRHHPVPIGAKRGKSCTPILDNVSYLAREFGYARKDATNFQQDCPFQPQHIYDKICMWKSECLKGQQEDAEEFLSFILNGIHGEIVALMKHYESKAVPNSTDSDRLNNNGHIEESDEEDWKVMGSNRRGIVIRSVVNDTSVISELVSGEFKTFLTVNGKVASASVQRFFTLQLDIQADNVTSLEEALYQLTAKEPIQGYTCPKLYKEVEAYSRIFIQKLPPVLILHLKRFVYNPNGGCKKLFKYTKYPVYLNVKKEWLAQDIRRGTRVSAYRLFAVMYHDGDEAVKGHYLTDIYNFGNRTWVRCDDKSIFPITDSQVLGYEPPRVPYLLFYQDTSYWSRRR